jgi:MFS family permease
VIARGVPHVPGTVLLDELAAQSVAVTHDLKHGRGKNSDIILIPQPSEDPNDPLNWPQWQKDLQMAVLAFGATVFAACFGPLLVAAMMVISAELDVSVTKVAQLGGYQLLVVGATGPFVCAISRKYGKRPVFLFSGLMGIIGTVIGGCANDYHLLLVGRIVQGFATSAFESIVVTVIGDMYFVHERGVRVSLLNFILGAISSLVSVISGPITTSLGWKFCFWVLLPFCCVQWILMILFCPESNYNRDALYNLDINATENFDKLAELEHKRAEQEESSPAEAATRKSFWRRLAPAGGIYSSDNLIRLSLAPFLSLTNVAALWVTVMSGLLVGWYVAVSFIMAQWFTPAPYNYSAADIGYLNIGPTIGGLCASVFMSAVSDPIIRFAAKRNKGIYEPEFRLFPMVVCFVFTIVGLALYGYGLKSHWAPPVTAVVHAILLFGILVGAIASSAYILDAFRDLSNEVFIMMMAFKNFFFYGMSYYVNNWIMRGGPMQMFGTFAGISAFLVLLGIPLYIFGKRYRSFWARHNLMRYAGLKSQAADIGY